MQGRSNRTPKRSARKRVIADAYELLARRVDLTASPAAALSPLRPLATPKSRRDARMCPAAGSTPIDTSEAARRRIGRYGSPVSQHAHAVAAPVGTKRRGTPVRAAATPPAAQAPARGAATPSRVRSTAAVAGTGTSRREPSTATGRPRSRLHEQYRASPSTPVPTVGLAATRQSPRTPGSISAASVRDEHQATTALREISSMIGVMDRIHMFGAQAGDEVAAFVEADACRHAQTATATRRSSKCSKESC